MISLLFYHIFHTGFHVGIYYYHWVDISADGLLIP